MMKRFVLLLIGVLALGQWGVAAAAPDKPKLLMFDFALQDYMKSDDGAADDPLMLRRTLDLSDEVRTYLKNEGRFSLVDNANYRDAIEKVTGGRNFFACRACYMAAAKTAGADYVAVGWVQRVSNLIIEFNFRVEEVATGKVVDKSYISIRGNSDKSWHDGAMFLMKDYQHHWSK